MRAASSLTSLAATAAVTPATEIGMGVEMEDLEAGVAGGVGAHDRKGD
jgi:hypothetical protein